MLIKKTTDALWKKNGAHFFLYLTLHRNNSYIVYTQLMKRI